MCRVRPLRVGVGTSKVTVPTTPAGRELTMVRVPVVLPDATTLSPADAVHPLTAMSLLIPATPPPITTVPCP